MELIVGGIVIGGVIIYFLGRAAIRSQCQSVQNDYNRDADAAAAKYGHPTYAAWLAAQGFVVRWFC